MSAAEGCLAFEYKGTEAEPQNLNWSHVLLVATSANLPASSEPRRSINYHDGLLDPHYLDRPLRRRRQTTARRSCSPCLPSRTSKRLPSSPGLINVSTLEQVERGVAALLSFPVRNEANSRAGLEHYANNFVYISSALTTQRELFSAALRATETRGWTGM